MDRKHIADIVRKNDELLITEIESFISSKNANPLQKDCSDSEIIEKLTLSLMEVTRNIATHEGMMISSFETSVGKKAIALVEEYGGHLLEDR